MCGGSIGDSSGTIVGCNSVYISPSLSPVRGTVSETNDSCYGSGEGVAGTSDYVSKEDTSGNMCCVSTAAEIFTLHLTVLCDRQRVCERRRYFLYSSSSSAGCIVN